MKKKSFFAVGGFVAVFTLGVSHAETPQSDIVIAGVRAKVRASSELSSKSSPGRYSPVNAFDGDNTTAWVEGNATDGLGEWIELEFSQPQLVSSVEISNGYQKTDKTFIENNRLESVDISFDSQGGALFRDVHVNKKTTIQINKLVNKIRFTAQGIVKGSKYNDLSLSDISIQLQTVACGDMILPKSVSWAYCTKNNVPGTVVAGALPILSFSSSLEPEQVRRLSDATTIKVEQLPDFQKGEVLLFKLTAVYEYETDYYLHFVQADSKSLLFFHQREMSDDGSFEYTMSQGDFNNDGMTDVRFDGDCTYPDGCPNFKRTVKYLSNNKRALQSRVAQ